MIAAFSRKSQSAETSVRAALVSADSDSRLTRCSKPAAARGQPVEQLA